MEQPRMEGTYKKNWFQIHFASRSYGEYWGVPRTYIKLQFKEDKKFDEKILSTYSNKEFKGMNIININHIKRSYKNYLILRVNYFILDMNKIKQLMDYLIDVSKKYGLSTTFKK